MEYKMIRLLVLRLFGCGATTSKPATQAKWTEIERETAQATCKTNFTEGGATNTKGDLLTETQIKSICECLLVEAETRYDYIDWQVNEDERSESMLAEGVFKTCIEKVGIE